MTIKFSAILCILTLSSTMKAQVFFSEDFSGGLPIGWKTFDLSNQNVLWTYCANPDSCVNYHSKEKVATTSVNNGLMVMNSDAYYDIDPTTGQPTYLTNNHSSVLAAPVIDCSDKKNVILRFESYSYTYNPFARGYVLVSNDSLKWQYFDLPFYPQYPQSLPSKYISKDPEKTELDISSVAANQSKVYIRWVFWGNWEYWFFLDDIALHTEPEVARLKVVNSVYPCKYYKTPEVVQSQDSMKFSFAIKNLDTVVAMNIVAKVSIYDNLNAKEVYSDSLLIGNLLGDENKTVLFPKPFAKSFSKGAYSINYSCYSSTGFEADLLDNTKSLPFYINVSSE